MTREFDELSGRALAAAVAVHKTLGPGFLESVYERALAIALRRHNIPFAEQKEVQISFEGVRVGCHRMDLVVDNQIVVEIKAVRALEDIHFAQLKSYLKATGIRVGLLLNFNAPTLVARRVVF